MANPRCDARRGWHVFEPGPTCVCGTATLLPVPSETVADMAKRIAVLRLTLLRLAAEYAHEMTCVAVKTPQLCSCGAFARRAEARADALRELRRDR